MMVVRVGLGKFVQLFHLFKGQTGVLGVIVVAMHVVTTLT
jgi:hypothetical protein